MEHLEARDLRKAQADALAQPRPTPAATSGDATISGMGATGTPEATAAIAKFEAALKDPRVKSDDLLRLGIQAGVYKVNKDDPPRFKDTPK